MVLKFSLRRVFKTIYCISYTKGKRQVLTGTIWKQNKRLISRPKKYQTLCCFMVIQLTDMTPQMEKSEILSGKSSSTPRNLPLISNSRICNLQVFDLTVGQLWKILLSRSEKMSRWLAHNSPSKARSNWSWRYSDVTMSPNIRIKWH